MTDHNDDDEMLLAYLEVTMGDPGDPQDDDPKLQPLCRECVRELPDGDDGLCAFCRMVIEP